MVPILAVHVSLTISCLHRDTLSPLPLPGPVRARPGPSPVSGYRLRGRPALHPLQQSCGQGQAPGPVDGNHGRPVLGDRDPEAESLGKGAAGGDVDCDGLPQPEQWYVRGSYCPTSSFLHTLHADSSYELKCPPVRGPTGFSALAAHDNYPGSICFFKCRHPAPHPSETPVGARLLSGSQGSTP